MKLIHEIINRRLEVGKDFELNNEHFKYIWTFYEVYKLCLNFLGIIDNRLNKKLKLIRSLILNPESTNLINRLKEHIAEDTMVIEMTLNSISETEDIEEIFDDFYPDSVFGVNIDDRN